MRAAAREAEGKGSNSKSQIPRKLQESNIKSSMARELNLEMGDLNFEPSLEFEF
jgi:hypothetical protein